MYLCKGTVNYTVAFNVMQDDRLPLPSMELKQGQAKFLMFCRLLLSRKRQHLPGNHSLLLPLQIMANIEQDPDHPGLQEQIIFKICFFLPAAPDGFLDRILLIRFRLQLTSHNSVKRWQHPDNLCGEGFAGHFGLLYGIVCKQSIC